MDFKEACFNNLKNYLSDGFTNSYTNTLIDSNRPLLSLNWLQKSSKIVAQIKGLDLTGGSLYENCFLQGCYKSTGIWTKALKSKKSILVEGEEYYWIEGALDKEGNCYVADIGYIYDLTGETVLETENVGLQEKGYIVSEIDNFKTKYIQVKRVGVRNYKIILSAYSDINFIRSSFSTLQNIEDKQEIEEIILGLITLKESIYIKEEKGREVYRGKYYREKEIDKLLDQVNSLNNIINKDTTSNKYGSIPRYVNRYTDENIYSKKREEELKSRSIRIYEQGCVEEDCIVTSLTNKLVSREVSTRTIGWFLYLLSLYGTKYNLEISLLTSFIRNEFDYSKQLLFDGWEDNEEYSLSERKLTHSFSTQVSCVLGLLKAYESTFESDYLDLACDIFVGTNNLKTEEDLFPHSYENREKTIESISYSLLLASTLEIDNIQSIIEYFNSRINNRDREQVFVGTQSLQVDGKDIEVETDRRYYEILTSNEEVSKIDLIKNYIFIKESLKKLEERGYLVQQIEDREEKFKEYSKKEENISLFYCGNEILEQGFIHNKKIDIKVGRYLNSLLFYRELIRDKLRKMWPIGRVWPEKEALQIGVLGQINRAVARSLAIWDVQINRIKRSRFISDSIQLEEWGIDFRLSRKEGEEKELFKTRIKKELVKEGGRSKDILDNLREKEYEVEVEDKWKEIVRTSTYEKEMGMFQWGEGKYGGSKITTGVIEVRTNQPFNNEGLEELKTSSSAGVKSYIIESLCTYSSLFTSSIDLEYFPSSPILSSISIITSLPTPTLDTYSCAGSMFTAQVSLDYAFEDVLYVLIKADKTLEVKRTAFSLGSGVQLVFNAGETTKQITYNLATLNDCELEDILLGDGNNILMSVEECYCS